MMSADDRELDSLRRRVEELELENQQLQSELHYLATKDNPESLRQLMYWEDYAKSDDEPKTRQGYYRWVDEQAEIGRARAIREERRRGF